MKPGLSVSSRGELFSALRLVRDVETQFAVVRQSPAADNVATVTATALLAAAALLDFVETFNIPTENFLEMAKQADTETELREVIFTYIKEQKD